MEVLLLVCYSLLFLLFVYKSGLFATPSVSRGIWVLLATVKIIVALTYGWLHHEIPTFYDSGFYFNEGNIVYSALSENPMYYLQLLLGRNNYFPEPEHLCSYIDQMGLWYDHTGYTIVRVNAFFRLFSFGYISVHFLFFSFISYIGAFYLYKFFSSVTQLSEYLILFLIFLIPGIVFWTSGLHKDALVFFNIGILLYNVYQLTMRFSKLRAFIVFIAFVFMINVRMYMFLVLMPALFAFFWNEKSKIKSVYPYLITYGMILLSLVLFDFVAPEKYRLVNLITEFQSSFINSDGNTSFQIDVVDHSWYRIFLYFPNLFINGFIHPIYSQCITDWCRLAAIETILLCVVIVFSLFKIKWRYLLDNSIALFCLSIGFTLISIIGIVVNNAGAIVRYRSIAVLFILIGLILSSLKISKNH